MDFKDSKRVIEELCKLHDEYGINAFILSGCGYKLDDLLQEMSNNASMIDIGDAYLLNDVIIIIPNYDAEDFCITPVNLIPSRVPNYDSGLDIEFKVYQVEDILDNDDIARLVQHIKVGDIVVQ